VAWVRVLDQANSSVSNTEDRLRSTIGKLICDLKERDWMEGLPRCSYLGEVSGCGLHYAHCSGFLFRCRFKERLKRGKQRCGPLRSMWRCCV
jgi:hypothetical protein